MIEFNNLNKKQFKKKIKTIINFKNQKYIKKNYQILVYTQKKLKIKNLKIPIKNKISKKNHRKNKKITMMRRKRKRKKKVKIIKIKNH